MRDDEGDGNESRPGSGDSPPGRESPSDDGLSSDEERSVPGDPIDPVRPSDSASDPTGSNRSGHDAPTEREDGPGWPVYLYDLVSSVAIVLLIGGLLFTASGVWPPMVAIESPSMEPTMERGDLVYVMEGDRFPGEGAHPESGVVPAERGRETDYRKFGGYGDVIVFKPDGNERETPIIHRAMLWVERDERWIDRANPGFLSGADSCEELPNSVCPAPHAGFITKGDNNPSYDQVSGIVRKGPVKPGWIIGTAELHVPYLGQIRLTSAGASQFDANVTAGADGP